MERMALSILLQPNMYANRSYEFGLPNGPIGICTKGTQKGYRDDAKDSL